MESKKIDPEFNKYQNPKIGLIALASDYMIEKDFIKRQPYQYVMLLFK